MKPWKVDAMFSRKFDSESFERLDRPRKILIHSTNWIGDAVMSIAALRELRRIFPEDHLALLAVDWVAEIFSEEGLVDEIISFPKERSSLACRSQLKDQQLAILFPNSFRAALLTFLSRVPQRVGYATDRRTLLLTASAVPRIKERHRHQIYYYLDLLFQAGLSEVDYLARPDFSPDISLKPTAMGIEKADQLVTSNDAGPLVGINPGAYFGPAKRWFTDRYAALADQLIEKKSAQVLIFGSADEIRIAREIESLMRNSPRIMAGKTDLETLIALISKCDLFVTNDSGPMHLAAALETPLLALFGSTDEVATGPFSRSAEVIHKHVECSPCLLRDCPIDLRCFDRISADEVVEAAIRRLS